MQTLVEKIRKQNVMAIVFDFDNTITLKSRGLVRKDKFLEFCQDNISTCFLQILPILLRGQYRVGVATFSDSKNSTSTHVAGRKLVRSFLTCHFGQDMASRVDIVAGIHFTSRNVVAAPGTSRHEQSPTPADKQYHLDQLVALWGMARSQVALVDDCAENISAARMAGHPAVHVCGGGGVRVEHLQQLADPMCSPLSESAGPAPFASCQEQRIGDRS
jgi:hypothetical protein